MACTQLRIMPTTSLGRWRVFKKKFPGGKGAEFAEYFRRNTVIRKMLWSVRRLNVFFINKLHKKIGTQAKKLFSH